MAVCEQALFSENPGSDDRPAGACRDLGEDCQVRDAGANVRVGVRFFRQDGAIVENNHHRTGLNIEPIKESLQRIEANPKCSDTAKGAIGFVDAPRERNGRFGVVEPRTGRMRKKQSGRRVVLMDEKIIAIA